MCLYVHFFFCSLANFFDLCFENLVLIAGRSFVRDQMAGQTRNSMSIVILNEAYRRFLEGKSVQIVRVPNSRIAIYY